MSKRSYCSMSLPILGVVRLLFCLSKKCKILSSCAVIIGISLRKEAVVLSRREWSAVRNTAASCDFMGRPSSRYLPFTMGQCVDLKKWILNMSSQPYHRPVEEKWLQRGTGSQHSHTQGDQPSGLPGTEGFPWMWDFHFKTRKSPGKPRQVAHHTAHIDDLLPC